MQNYLKRLPNLIPIIHTGANILFYPQQSGTILINLYDSLGTLINTQSTPVEFGSNAMYIWECPSTAPAGMCFLQIKG